MTIRELLDELRRIAEMQSMADTMDAEAQPGNAKSSHLLNVAIRRAQASLQARFSPSQIETARRMQQILSDEAA